MANLQAVLWYAEKRLYAATKEDNVDAEETEGYGKFEALVYANAAAEVARAKGISERKIQNAFKKYGRAATTRRSDGNPLPGEKADAGQQAEAGGFTTKERREFLQSLAVGRARNHRASDGGKSWSFTRDGGANGGRLRLLKSLGIRYSSLWKSGTGLNRVYKAAGLTAPDFVELVAGDLQGATKFAASIQASKDRDPIWGRGLRLHRGGLSEHVPVHHQGRHLRFCVEAGRRHRVSLRQGGIRAQHHRPGRPLDESGEWSDSVARAQARPLPERKLDQIEDDDEQSLMPPQLQSIT
jgi:hypothetical protein